MLLIGNQVVRASFRESTGGTPCLSDPLGVPQIAAQPIFSPEENGFDGREAAVECAGNLGVTHALVVAEQ